MSDLAPLRDINVAYVVLIRWFPKMYINPVLSSGMLKMSDQHTLVPSMSADTLNLLLLIFNKNDITECLVLIPAASKVENVANEKKESQFITHLE